MSSFHVSLLGLVPGTSSWSSYSVFFLWLPSVSSSYNFFLGLPTMTSSCDFHLCLLLGLLPITSSWVFLHVSFSFLGLCTVSLYCDFLLCLLPCLLPISSSWHTMTSSCYFQMCLLHRSSYYVFFLILYKSLETTISFSVTSDLGTKVRSELLCRNGDTVW